MLKSSKKKRIKKRRITLRDRIAPFGAESISPHCTLYNQLLGVERTLAPVLARKTQEFQHALKQPVRIPSCLRIFISHEWKDRSNVIVTIQGTLVDYNGSSVSFLNESHDNTDKFSTFFEKISLVWGMEEETEIEEAEEDSGDENQKEKIPLTQKFPSKIWYPSTGDAADGTTFSISTADPSQPAITVSDMVFHPESANPKVFEKADEKWVTVQLSPLYFPKRFDVKEPLHTLLQVKGSVTKTEALFHLWQYIKANKLQEAEHRRNITNNESFQEIFECNKMKLSSLGNRLDAFLEPAGPVSIQYCLSGQPHRVSYDIIVESPDPITFEYHKFLAAIDSDAAIDKADRIDEEIATDIAHLTEMKRKRDFMLAFAEDPVGFSRRWTESMARDTQLAAGAETREAALAQETSYYTGDWVEDSLWRYLYRSEIDHTTHP